MFRKTIIALKQIKAEQFEQNYLAVLYQFLQKLKPFQYNTVNCLDFSPDFSESLKNQFSDSLTIKPDFLSVSEEESLLAEIEPKVRKRRYEFDHWDNAIHGYRETEHFQWNSLNSGIMQRVQNFIFTDTPLLPNIHVLDLHENGFIKPHIDSTRFCGNIIAGLNLLSDAMMRFKRGTDCYCDVLIKRRSLYAMKGSARYDFTHEILPSKMSVFKGMEVNRKRRVSIILRSEPQEKTV